MARVEMAELIAALVTLLEQVVRQIRVKVVKEDGLLPFSHHMVVVLSLWAERVALVYLSFNILHNYWAS
jgi:hypothetical protein